MFDVGFWELVLLGVIALVVLGPERLPQVARTAGRWVGRARSYASNLTDELERQTRDAEGGSGIGTLRDELNRTRDELTRARDELNHAAERLQSDSHDVVEELEAADRATAQGADDTATEVVAHDASGGEDPAADFGDADAYVDDYLSKIPEDLTDYADAEPFSVEKARAEHARRDHANEQSAPTNPD